MADKTTTTAKSGDKSKDLEAENQRLRELLEANGIKADVNPNEGIVGNLADVQRFFGSVASGEGSKVEEAVVKPATVDPDTGETTPAAKVSDG